jgi:hypothetical protein
MVEARRVRALECAAPWYYCESLGYIRCAVHTLAGGRRRVAYPAEWRAQHLDAVCECAAGARIRNLNPPRRPHCATLTHVHALDTRRSHRQLLSHTDRLMHSSRTPRSSRPPPLLLCPARLVRCASHHAARELLHPTPQWRVCIPAQLYVHTASACTDLLACCSGCARVCSLLAFHCAPRRCADHGDPLPLHTILSLSSCMSMIISATNKSSSGVAGGNIAGGRPGDGDGDSGGDRGPFSDPESSAPPSSSSLCTLTVNSYKFVYLDIAPYTLVAQGNGEESEQFLGTYIYDVRNIIQTYLGNGVVHHDDVGAIKGIVVRTQSHQTRRNDRAARNVHCARTNTSLAW